MEAEDVRAERLRVEEMPQGGEANAAAIVIRDLRKTFPPVGGGREKQAVRGLSLAIERGECFGLLGECMLIKGIVKQAGEVRRGIRGPEPGLLNARGMLGGCRREGGSERELEERMRGAAGEAQRAGLACPPSNTHPCAHVHLCALLLTPAFPEPPPPLPPTRPQRRRQEHHHQHPHRVPGAHRRCVGGGGGSGPGFVGQGEVLLGCHTCTVNGAVTPTFAGTP